MTPTDAQTVRELVKNANKHVTVQESCALDYTEQDWIDLRVSIAAVEALLAREEKEEIKPLDRAFLQDAGDAIKAKLPDSYGFILLAFPFNGEGDQRLVYCSNAQRADALNTVKEWLLKCGASEDWMKHIN